MHNISVVSLAKVSHVAKFTANFGRTLLQGMYRKRSEKLEALPAAEDPGR